MPFLRRRRSRIVLNLLAISIVISSTAALDHRPRSGYQFRLVSSAQAATESGGTAAAPAQAAAAATQPGPAPGAATPEDLQQLVSPIALYPDMLIAQILAASTYPTQVVKADRFIKKNPNLTGKALAAQINPQSWDSSVKSLCQFPSVLSTMSESLAWTSALGEAYYNQPNDLLAAIQVMRQAGDGRRDTEGYAATESRGKERAGTHPTSSAGRRRTTGAGRG
jgi:hypothetical protein